MSYKKSKPDINNAVVRDAVQENMAPARELTIIEERRLLLDAWQLVNCPEEPNKGGRPHGDGSLKADIVVKVRELLDLGYKRKDAYEKVGDQVKKSCTHVRDIYKAYENSR